jgi:hypothetical protein
VTRYPVVMLIEIQKQYSKFKTANPNHLYGNTKQNIRSGALSYGEHTSTRLQTHLKLQ